MKSYIGVGIAVGVLAGVWTQVSIWFGLVTWIAFVAWACFFAAGGGRDGLTKGLAANLSGVVYGWLAALFIGAVSFPGALAVAVAVIALCMCLQAGLPLLSFIPGAFVGTAVYFGSAFAFWPSVVALVIGAGLGWLSALLGERIQKMVHHEVAGVPETEGPAAPRAA